jgi:anaerobic dimethyl sulfoxide reductase subunit A
LRETWSNPVLLNRSDAAGLGIVDGDTTLISTPHGKVLRHAVLLDIIIPGLVGIPHGSWVDVDESTGIDRAGSDNYLTGPEYAGFGVSGYNNLNCKVEKYTGEALAADHTWPQRIVSA